MQCSSCGKDNQAATRFCIHCGAAQATVTEPAAGPTTVTAAMAQAGTRSTPPWAPAPAAAPAVPAASPSTASKPTTAIPAAPAARGAETTGAPFNPASIAPIATPRIEPAADESMIVTPPAVAQPPATSASAPVAFSDETAFVPAGMGKAPAPTAEVAGPPVDPDASWDSGATTTRSVAPRSDMPPPTQAAVLGATSATRTVQPRSSMPPPPPAPSFDESAHDAAIAPPPPSFDESARDAAIAPPPAYDIAPRKSGVFIVIGLAVIALAGIAAFFMYQITNDHDRAIASKGMTTTADASSAQNASTPAASSGQSTEAPTPSEPPAPAPSATPPAPTQQATPEPATVAPPPASTPSSAEKSGPTPSPAIEPPAKPAPRPKAQPRPPAPAAVTPPPAPEPELQPAPAPAPKAAPAPAAPVNDRWAQMNGELARCKGEDFIRRVACDQRVRYRYCQGYWGKVDQCPGGAQTADHGQ
jgi:hypothetical protein